MIQRNRPRQKEQLPSLDNNSLKQLKCLAFLKMHAGSPRIFTAVSIDFQGQRAIYSRSIWFR
ncbi:MAG TPA: hypothetical protein DDW94_07150 [Deltaproteobacteria bacterium]|nr:MAG: hypothetical protein A2Z79_01680 [Deltaproteobacteria bacterium GWA2_55_82]OGQ62009.1 MAG: hypothetical protein A3I81_03525 [Deltaproteobacteria bacterium RIFCSPLOWO2_02_FULL_55_12]OIJ74133.1 MAG: hypothetical protein A2V21_307585 [Deltaproteobacteria bacterium GWC2_55_46]HBG46751.1 hypothetical protein [Deltaproteobacteria bacterium]HCY11240.1 hypothetical protein [Deltaproteobacteria bacterium]